MAADYTFQFEGFTTRLLFQDLASGYAAICARSRRGRVLLVCDDNTRPLLDPYIGTDARTISPLVLPAGERHKNRESLERILHACVNSALGRDDGIAAFGGGVICDIAAFAASVYMRGIGLVLLPTTLLAMVDASLGGKTGINYRGYKNLVGTFYPASEVLVCPEVLKSLPDREYRSGLAEVIKSALLGDEEFIRLLELKREEILHRSGAASLIEELISRSILVKADHVSRDLKESGIRAYLNLGHTFAHALESTAGLGAWSHGEAVAWGIAKAMEAGRSAGLTDARYAERVLNLLNAYGYRTGACGEDGAELMEAMKQDKKKREGDIRFVLQKRCGETFLSSLPDEVVAKVLNNYSS
jgi:3-dehydroquinate synthase